MNTKPSAFKNIMPYGVLTAVVLMLYNFMLINMQIQTGPLPWISYLLTAGGLYYGVNKYKTTALKGFITYGQSLGTMTLMMLIIGGLSALFIGFYSSFDPTMIEQILAKAEKGMEEKGNTPEQIAIGMKYTKMMTTPIWMGIWTFVGYMFVGFIISLLLSAIVKKDNPNPFAEMEGETVSN